MSDEGLLGVRLTDWQIVSLLAERKKLMPSDLQRLRNLLPQGKTSLGQDIEIMGADGSVFRLILRQSRFNPLDFSAILGYKLPDTGRLFRLRRYDSKNEHRNPIEKQQFDDFHVHTATARYQARQMSEETYAEPSSRFRDLHGALYCLLNDCGFDLPQDQQENLFPGLP